MILNEFNDKAYNLKIGEAISNSYEYLTRLICNYLQTKGLYSNVERVSKYRTGGFNSEDYGIKKWSDTSGVRIQFSSDREDMWGSLKMELYLKHKQGFILVDGNIRVGDDYIKDKYKTTANQTIKQFCNKLLDRYKKIESKESVTQYKSFNQRFYDKTKTFGLRSYVSSKYIQINSDSIEHKYSNIHAFIYGNFLGDSHINYHKALNRDIKTLEDFNRAKSLLKYYIKNYIRDNDIKFTKITDNITLGFEQDPGCDKKANLQHGLKLIDDLAIEDLYKEEEILKAMYESLFVNIFKGNIPDYLVSVINRTIEGKY